MSTRINKIDQNATFTQIKNPSSQELKKAKEEFQKQFPGISCGFGWDDDGNKCLAVRGSTKKSLEKIPDIFNGIKVQKGVVGTITTQSE